MPPYVFLLPRFSLSLTAALRFNFQDHPELLLNQLAFLLKKNNIFNI